MKIPKTVAVVAFLLTVLCSGGVLFFLHPVAKQVAIGIIAAAACFAIVSVGVKVTVHFWNVTPAEWDDAMMRGRKAP